MADLETITLTKQQFKMAILHGWKNCLPAHHMDYERAWEWATDPTCDRNSCKHTADGRSFDSSVCWGGWDDDRNG